MQTTTPEPETTFDVDEESTVLDEVTSTEMEFLDETTDGEVTEMVSTDGSETDDPETTSESTDLDETTTVEGNV